MASEGDARRLLAAAVIASMLLAVGGAEGGPGAIAEKYGAMVRVVARELVNRYYADAGAGEVAGCTCSFHDCGDFFPETACIDTRHQEDLDCGPAGPCGRMLVNPELSGVRTPPGLITEDPSLSPDVLKDICLTQGLEETFKKAANFTTGFEPWMYVAMARSGVMRTWPLKPREREPNGQCVHYDPRDRPWFKSATSEPKKVVIIVQASDSMRLPFHMGAGSVGKSRWRVALDAIRGILNTLDHASDYVNVVTFSADAKPLMDGGLVIADVDNIDSLAGKLENVTLAAGADNKKAFDLAFDLLDGSISRAGIDDSCQNIIIHIGDGSDCTTSTRPQGSCSLGESSSGRLPDGVFKNLEAVRERQERLEQDSSRAAIFTCTVENADDSLARQMACANGGTWFTLDGRGEPLNNMEGYFQYLALAVERHLGGANEPVLFSPLYEDASGLGIMTTVSQPIFVNPRCAERNSTVGRLLLGIVAKDITLASLLEAGLTQQMVETMTRESLGAFRRCNEDYKYAHCKMQTIRGAATECPHRLWNASMAETDMCYRFKGRHYLLRAEPKGFLSAAQSCTAIGGRLVELSDEGEGEGDQQHFLASIVPPDGAWIGLRPSAESAGWQWVGSMRQVDAAAATGRLWATPPRRDLSCVGGFIDARGTSRNVGGRKCPEATAYVCEFEPSASELPAACMGDVEVVGAETLRSSTASGCLQSDGCVGQESLELDPSEEEAICNLDARTTKATPYSELVCCSEQDLRDQCPPEDETKTPRATLKEDGSNADTIVKGDGEGGTSTSEGPSGLVLGMIVTLSLLTLLAVLAVALYRIEVAHPGTLAVIFAGCKRWCRGGSVRRPDPSPSPRGRVELRGFPRPHPPPGDPPQPAPPNRDISFDPENPPMSPNFLPRGRASDLEDLLKSPFVAPGPAGKPDPERALASSGHAGNGGTSDLRTRASDNQPVREILPSQPREVRGGGAMQDDPAGQRAWRGAGPSSSSSSPLLSPPEGWAPPIQGITNYMPLNGGWSAEGAHGYVREGVWISDAGKAIKVAIKTSKEKKPKCCQELIRKEFNILLKIPYHPNIIWVIGGRLDEMPVIVEEFMDNSLQDLLDDEGPGMTYRQILKIGLDAARGIEHLHSNQVVHYDIKPANILLDKRLNAKLADFTLSKLKTKVTITVSGRGTPGYIAPECWQVGYARVMLGPAMPKVHVRAEKIDVYSLGKVLVKCVTGDLCESEVAKRRCPGILWGLISECVRMNPADRPPCGEVVRRLEQMLSEEVAGEDWRRRRPKQEIWQPAIQ